ncbi:Cytochrome B561 [Sphingobium herbicidovorans NBRC 16415]|uniref:Cytochrome B561 n=1 Tax=Sphingobium herbicidovorans (strain ATCC 700291 / DSM 11019 / CCUG 56400 / KCTC 2939 / LMG 18315 / NBRC 16415 / MH) TaxID=1219045 RepID=A0A086PC19_SPHHM|nr:cytochrome c oxidase subunit 3 [Sphingobium herbicidovorans]KFG90937.1 Cytochrome B561 [Sphingobium herbicidovorans NBRC 16415]
MKDERQLTSGKIPGEPGLWVMILGDLFVFALLFGTVAYYRMEQPAVFHASHPTLNQALGLTNTFVLLTSSLLVVLGLEAARKGEDTAAIRWITNAKVLGLIFICIKSVEYYQKWAEGLLPSTNIFFMLYFVITGIHLIHVLIGLAALQYFGRLVSGKTQSTNLELIECCALFWHLVDVLWVFLFAIFYIHR